MRHAEDHRIAHARAGSQRGFHDGRIQLPASHVDEVAHASRENQPLGGAPHQIARHEATGAEHFRVRLREIARAHRCTAHPDTAGILSLLKVQRHALQRLPHKALRRGALAGIIGNAATFTAAVKAVDLHPIARPEGRRHRGGERSSRADTQAQARQRSGLQLGELLKEDRQPRKDRGPGGFQLAQDGPGEPILRRHHGHAAAQQRRDQIAKAVAVRPRDDAEIQIPFPDAHRVAHRLAVRD